jgi:VWFA-related protein
MGQSLIAFVLLACAASAQVKTAETDVPAVFRSGVSNVRVDVQVTEDGKLIKDLKAEDFTLFENNRQMQLLSASLDPEPLALVLLLDVSGSMRKHIEEMAGVTTQALGYLRKGDRVAVMVFATRAKVRKPFTVDLGSIAADIKDAVSDQDVGSETAINRSILDAVKYIEDSAGSGRRGVLIVTDNLGTNNDAPDERVIESLLKANTILDAIVIGPGSYVPPAGPRPGKEPGVSYPNVFWIAAETGGDATKSQTATAAFPEMIERIRARYSLAYRPPAGAAGVFRAIKVELTPAARLRYPNAQLRYRRGYYFAH